MNAQPKHTPGPWRIGDAGKTVFGPFTAEPCPVTVARMPEASPRCGADERKANVLLIAAAPEMAAALLALVDTANAHCPVDHPALPLARNILRKAGLLS